MSIDLGVGILPDAKTREMAIRLSRALGEKYRTSYTLGHSYHPHVTLYQATFQDYATLLNSIGKIRHLSLTGIQLEPEDLVVTPSNYIFIRYAKTPELEELQSNVINSVASSRLKGVPTIWDKNKVALSPEKAIAVQQWGFVEAFETFDPHLTIGRITDDNMDCNEVLSLLSGIYENIDFMPIELVTYELGADGGCLNPRKI
ncbi:MAG TPA: hypothetical protein VI968_01525 [archaeon]|nr:hypothetical protein [archaeon]